MSPSPLAKKLKLNPGSQAAILNAPPGYLDELSPEDVIVDSTLNGQYDWIQIFVLTQAELEAIIPQVKAALKPISLLWLCFPKGTSKLQTDLTRDKGWDSVQDLKATNLVSINQTWSGFSVRPYRPREAKQSFL